MGEISENAMEGFFGVSPLPDGSSFRWTNGNARLSLGQMLREAPPFERLRLSVSVASRRPAERVPTSLYLNLYAPDQIWLLRPQEIGPDFEELSVEFNSSDLHTTSLFEIQSLKPAVGDDIATGALGIAVKDLRFEVVK
jgi:hypothetical protein